MHRIHNIVVVPPRPLHQQLRTPQRLQRQQPIIHSTLSRRVITFIRSIPSLIVHSVFPLDLSSTLSRFLFRIPSIYLLGKTIILWGILLLQGANVYPASAKIFGWDGWDWVGRLGEWAMRKPMDEVAWFTFASVCVTVFVAALTAGIEGTNTQSNPQFNLVGVVHAVICLT